MHLRATLYLHFMQIYLLRHGIAEEGRAGRPDSERALTDEGREKLGRVLRRAAAAGVSPSLILSSPYRRALETAEVAAKALDYPGEIIRTAALKPESAPVDVWQEIRERRSEDAILLASHEPLMSALAAYLLGNPAMKVHMKKGAMLRVDADAPGAEPRCVLKWMLTPALA